MRNRRRLAAALVGGTLLLAGASPAAGRPKGEGDDGAVGSAFAAAVRGEAVDPVALADALERIRPAPVPLLFAVLDRGEVRVPALGAGLVRHRLTAREGEVVARALAGAPPAALREHLEIVAGGPAAARAREIGLRLLGEVGDPADLALLVRLAAPAGGEGRLPHSRREAFEDAAWAVAARAPAGPGILLGLFAGEAPSLRAPLVRAIARSAHGDALRLLVRLLGRDPALDRAILAAVIRRAEWTPLPVDEDVREGVRSYLSAPDPDLVLLAVAAAGKLEDYAAVPILMEAIEAEDPNLRRSAFAALRHITRLTLRSDGDLWNRWYGMESAWWRDEATAAFAALREGEPREVVRAINSLAGRSLERHAVAGALLPCLEREESAVVAAACAALGKLGSRTAERELAGRLWDDDSAVVAAAAGALRAITAENPPPRPLPRPQGRAANIR
ncbi:MAG: hypothetical protein AB1726_05225 [Planctomycetota bacterium]